MTIRHLNFKTCEIELDARKQVFSNDPIMHITIKDFHSELDKEYSIGIETKDAIELLEVMESQVKIMREMVMTNLLKGE